MIKTHIITHHSNGVLNDPMASTQHHTVDDINAWHKKRWPEFVSELGYHVGYHYVILPDGEVVQTRKDSEEGAHTIGMNQTGIGVLFVGNKSGPDDDTPEMIRAWRDLAPKLMRRHNIPLKNIQPHRRYARKDCHGSKLSDDHYQKLLLEDRDTDIEAEEMERLRKEVTRLMGIVALLVRQVTAFIAERQGELLGSLTIKSSWQERLVEVNGKLGNRKIRD
jgi:hypothetical protein